MSRRQRRASTSRHASAHQTQAGDLDEEQDLASMAKQLKRVGLAIRDVRRDGNCFFRAVSDQIYGTEDHHAYLRHCACAFMQRNEELLAPFLDDETQSFQQYVDHMRTDGIWAGNIEIHAISMVCEVNIRIHQSSKPSYDLRNHEDDDARAIHLFYHFGEHYASVRPLRQLHDNAPAEHDPLPLGAASGDSGTSSGDGAGNGGGRRQRRAPEDVVAIWERVDTNVLDLTQLIEHAEAAARYFRRPAPDESAPDKASTDIVRELEREVRHSSDLLAEVSERVTSWRGAHAARAERREQNGTITADEDDDDTSGSERSSAYESCSEGWESDSTAVMYDRVVRRERKFLYTTLDQAEKRISAVLQRATEIRDGKARSSRAGKTRHPSKKKEQEEKRKQRKARRRQEQERTAKHSAARTEQGSGYSIGVWGVFPEVSI